MTMTRLSAPARRSAVSTKTALLGILTLGTLLRLALVVLLRNKQTHDSRIFVSWAHLLMQYGPHGLYAHVDTVDHFPVNYPPGFGLVLATVVGAFERLPTHGAQNDVSLAMLLKLPAIAADIVLCGLVFAIVRRWAGDRAGLGAAAVAAFAPSTWPISAIWGQVDSIPATLMVLALALTMSRRYALAWIALALAVLVKPLPLVIAPLLVVAQIVAEGPSLRLGLGPALAIVTGYAVALPFAPAFAPLPVLRWLAARFSAGQALSDSTSVNAYNLWTAVGPPTSDAVTLLGVSLHAWGWLVFGAVAGTVTLVSFVAMARRADAAARERLLAVAAFIVLTALFAFATRMHERYILFALALAPLMWSCGRPQRLAAATLLATFTLCVVLVLGFYERAGVPEFGWVTRVLSLFNLAALSVAALGFGAGAIAKPASGLHRPEP